MMFRCFRHLYTPRIRFKKRSRENESACYSAQVNMSKLKTAGRIPVLSTRCCSCQIDAYGWTSASFLYASTSPEEKTLVFMVWAVLGLAAGYIGSQLASRKRKGVLPDLILGLSGALSGGWLYFAFGPPSVNGLHLYSHYAAVIGSLVFLLLYYALRRN
jgi:uncharacterized membrane protein YeaQ/YmgE (transglycosylase-associated protein family)